MTDWPTEWFRGRVALVTGASSGMGREVALALGRAGVNVGVNFNRNQASAVEVVREIEAAGAGAIDLQADVSKGEDVDRMFTALANKFGERIDMLVNNAGDWMDKRPLAECDDEQWDRMISVNLRSVFLCCRAAAGKMIRQGDGAIVNFGSVAGHTGGGGGTVPYAAAKAAVHTLTRGLARELGPSGVRVNCISPGMIETPMLTNRVPAEAQAKLLAGTPLGRFGKANEVVPMVLTLLSPAGSYITGQVIQIDGGLLMR